MNYLRIFGQFEQFCSVPFRPKQIARVTFTGHKSGVPSCTSLAPLNKSFPRMHPLQHCSPYPLSSKQVTHAITPLPTGQVGAYPGNQPPPPPPATFYAPLHGQVRARAIMYLIQIEICGQWRPFTKKGMSNLVAKNVLTIFLGCMKTERRKYKLKSFYIFISLQLI